MGIRFNLHSKMETHKIKVKFLKELISRELILKYYKTQVGQLSLNRVNIVRALAILIQYLNKMKQSWELIQINMLIRVLNQFNFLKTIIYTFNQTIICRIIHHHSLHQLYKEGTQVSMKLICLRVNQETSMQLIVSNPLIIKNHIAIMISLLQVIKDKILKFDSIINFIF